MSRAPQNVAEPGQLSPFEAIAGYRLVRLLGQGGFADTFEATKDGGTYAVKILRELPIGTDAIRFEHEIAALKLEHPNLVRYVDSGIDEFGSLKRPFIVMPYLPGHTLKEAIESTERPLSIGDVTRVAASVADGLAFLHEHNIAHRDLNPKNIYLTDVGDVLILDFGLVKLLDHTSLTRRGQVLGTWPYCAPEQLRNETDLHTDLYGLGATVYHALTGKPPFLATSPVGFVDMIRDEDPEPPSVLNPGISEQVEELVLALLAKEPVQRPASAAAVAAALRTPQREASAKPTPYERDAAPILAVRATSSTAARATVGAAMLGQGPGIAIGSITTPSILEDLVRARGFDAEMQLIVDTKVETTVTAGIPKTVAERRFAPAEGRPYRHADLRGAEACQRIARGDIQEQDEEGASIFRSACLPFSRADDEWIKRDARLLGDQLLARDAHNAEAPLYATVRCEVEALLREEDRLAIANRFTRGAPEGFWFEAYGLSIHSPPEVIAAALEMFLLMQERGVPSIASLPGSLVELAWSIGVAGAEVKLGRVGGSHTPRTRPLINADRRPRFELLSVFGSFAPEDAVTLLELGVLPESRCGCPTCQLGGTFGDRVEAADSHGMAVWRGLQNELSEMSVADRLQRLDERFGEAEAFLREMRGTLPKSRGSKRHVTKLRNTLSLLSSRRVLGPFGKLKRPA
jgi:hypothetical protein